ncbi:MAG: hypothetical protein U0441_21235 [Polyangiaceae bacterium]
MKNRRAHRWALLAATPLFAWIAAPGCAPSSGSYCMKMCACADCSASDEADCIDLLKLTQRTSAEKGCGSQYDTFLSCADSLLTCGDGVPDRTCDDERSALTACTGGDPVQFGSLCTTACLRVGNLCGTSDLASCSSGCHFGDSNAQRSGCISAYNDYLICQLKVDDPCGGIAECDGDYKAYVKCLSDACSADPTKC